MSTRRRTYGLIDLLGSMKFLAYVEGLSENNTTKTYNFNPSSTGKIFVMFDCNTDVTITNEGVHETMDNLITSSKYYDNTFRAYGLNYIGVYSSEFIAHKSSSNSNKITVNPSSGVVTCHWPDGGTTYNIIMMIFELE